MRVMVYIAVSVDGFIAGPDGDISWLHNTAYTIAGEDFGYAKFMSEIDCLIMGRGTYEKVLEFAEWPFADKRVIVLSSTLRRLKAELPAELSSEDPQSLFNRLKAEGVRRCYVDGGKTIQNFLRSGLVTDMTLTKIPVLLGGGLPLFGENPTLIPLVHESTQAFANGFVQTRYSLARR